MKKCLGIVLFFALLWGNISYVYASSGQLRKASIKTCNGITYGEHSSDNHWHVAREDNGKYYATGDPIYGDPCASSDVSSENNSNNTEDNQDVYYPPQDDVKEDLSKPEEVKSSDNTIKKVIIDGEEFAWITGLKYFTTKDEVDVLVIPNDEKATYEVENNHNLEVGDNIVTIEVTAEDGAVEEYPIYVNKEKNLSSDTGITITINGEEVDFHDYTATIYVSSSTTDLEVLYDLRDKNARVEMDEIELLSGDNHLAIRVIAEDGTNQVYDITIHKYTKMEEMASGIVAIVVILGVGLGIFYFVKKKRK